MDVSATKYPVARKTHICNWCLLEIQIGEVYEKQTVFSDGSAYTWKNHRHCSALTTRLEMFKAFDYGDGLSQSDFWDCITEEFSNIMLEKEGVVYNSKFPMPYFPERMKVVRIHHDL